MNKNFDIEKSLLLIISTIINNIITNKIKENISTFLYSFYS